VCTGACSYIKRLTEVFQDLLKIDYRAVVSATLDILRLLPPSIEPRVRDLVNLAHARSTCVAQYALDIYSVIVLSAQRVLLRSGGLEYERSNY